MASRVLPSHVMVYVRAKGTELASTLTQGVGGGFTASLGTGTPRGVGLIVEPPIATWTIVGLVKATFGIPGESTVGLPDRATTADSAQASTPRAPELARPSSFVGFVAGLGPCHFSCIRLAPRASWEPGAIFPTWRTACPPERPTQEC